jgi:hypothetical protein
MAFTLAGFGVLFEPMRVLAASFWGVRSKPKLRFSDEGLFAAHTCVG